jgi:hypothetical protein
MSNDSNDFDNKVEQIVKAAFEDYYDQTQESFDIVFKSHAGRPKGEAEEALQQAFGRHRWALTPSQLAKASQAISDKRHVVLKDEGIDPEPIGNRLEVEPRTLEVRFTEGGKTKKVIVHCWDAESDVIGALPLDWPKVGPHMTVHPHVEGETYTREYNRAELPTLAQRNVKCPFPDNFPE